jgi:hypothetical protein
MLISPSEDPGGVPVPVQVVPLADLVQKAPGKVPVSVEAVPLANFVQEAPVKVPVPAEVVPCYKPAINGNGQYFVAASDPHRRRGNVPHVPNGQFQVHSLVQEEPNYYTRAIDSRRSHPHERRIRSLLSLPV